VSSSVLLALGWPCLMQDARRGSVGRARGDGIDAEIVKVGLLAEVTYPIATTIGGVESRLTVFGLSPGGHSSVGGRR